MANFKKPGEQKAARMMFTVPAAIKASIDGLPRENWSRVAASAFELRISQLQALQMNEVDMKTSIERLKNEAAAERVEMQLQGVADGTQWAAKEAAPKWLRKLDKITEDGFDSLVENERAMGEFGETIGGWQDTLGDEYADLLDDANYMTGFFKGAMQHWKAVKAHI